ncbi:MULTISPECIES: winged helix-turn-helix domain-containing protein [Pontibacillus]|uniref:HTH domain-containing protein n=1 Tax=Pontibacillus chungwhensis TaxID=265426 RepID=A0ABY8V0D5_9BACI|nr:MULTISPECIES: hypothetical protein [Pontibacillus]MCD5324506.1 hypothetical protein [Pontibacillus sp. HN14]WIF99199.1 hypothetical protein QNI29_05945 [Pontibacillus chungwhensis]
MRHDIQQNERAFSTKEVAEDVGIATTTVRRYGQILERNGYEFFKDGDRRIFVKSDVEAIRAIKSDKRNLPHPGRSSPGSGPETKGNAAWL